MIDLRTGVPGSGKTLSAVEALAKMIARWEKNPEESRPIFVHNVKDLSLPHAVLPVISVMVGKVKMDVPDWASVPDGAYILIDECQGFFPPRASGSAMPDHIAFLNTHRHHGFDITIITQHPRLIDTSVRALVGKHQHFRRMFGRQLSVCYEWDSCSDTLGGIANAVMSKFIFPKKAFEWYKSAEVHTKQSFRLPKWIFIPVIGVILGAVTVPFAYTRIVNLGSADKLKSNIEEKTHAKSPVQQTTTEAVKLTAQASNAIVAAATQQAASAPVAASEQFSGCMATPTKCVCFTVAGVKKERSEDECKEHMAGNFPSIKKNPVQSEMPKTEPLQSTADGEVFASMQAYRRKVW